MFFFTVFSLFFLYQCLQLCFLNEFRRSFPFRLIFNCLFKDTFILLPLYIHVEQCFLKGFHCFSLFLLSFNCVFLKDSFCLLYMNFQLCFFECIFIDNFSYYIYDHCIFHRTFIVFCKLLTFNCIFSNGHSSFIFLYLTSTVLLQRIFIVFRPLY